MEKKLSITVFLFLLATLIFAQGRFSDKLIQRNGKTIVCQVREIGDDEIKYVMEGYRDDLVFGIDKNKVVKVIFADGREMDIADSMYGRENYAEQNKNALKFHFFSPLSGATAFSYERSLKPGRSIEAGLGIVGVGYMDESIKDASGFYTSLGYKFIKDPDFYVKGMRYAHILKGSYVKPELAFAIYSYHRNRYYWYNGNEQILNEKSSVTKGAFIINVGKQWIFSDRFLIDWHFGAGYGFKDEGAYNDPNYGFLVGDHDYPLVVNGGFKIGILF